MTTTSKTLVIALCLLVALAVTTGVSAGSPPCNCYKGKTELTAPRCICNCDEGYMPPYCAFKGDEIVRVEVWFDLKMQSFISTKIISVMSAELSAKVNSSLLPKINFVYLKPSTNHNKTLALFDMPGMAVNWLYHYTWNEPEPRKAWPYAKLKITAVYFTEELTDPDHFLTNLLRTTYLYNDGLVVVSLADCIWLLGVLVFCLAIVIVEKVYSTNDEKDIETDLAMGTLDPYSASKYQS